MRQQKRTWQEIAEWLKSVHGISVLRTSVILFFKRATKRRNAPLGYPEDFGRKAAKHEARPHNKASRRTAALEIDSMIEDAEEEFKAAIPRPVFKIRRPRNQGGG